MPRQLQGVQDLEIVAADQKGQKNKSKGRRGLVLLAEKEEKMKELKLWPEGIGETQDGNEKEPELWPLYQRKEEK